jgi:hypothetical protein
MNDKTGKVLRSVGLIFFGLTTAMNLLGGIGTSCAAFLTKQYPPYWALIKQDMQWLYQGLVITTVVIGLVGIWALIELTRGKKNAFRNALIVLVIGTILSGIQFYYSMQLFGKATPANVKFFSNAITLILFLIFLIPGVRQKVNFTKNEGGTDKETAGGMAAIMVGILLLTTPIWAGPSHTFQGVNWVHLLQTELNLSGILLIGAGLAILVRVAIGLIRYESALAKIEVPTEK